MRAAVLAVLVLSLACARSTTPSETGEGGASPQPSEVEGPAPASEPVAEAGDLCVLGPYAEWSKCDGQRVRIEGRAAEHVMQHPMLEQPEGMSPDGRNTHQGYMDTDDAQIIVLTSAPFDCAAGMSVVGTLREIDLGGEPGTKNSYGGWAIEDAEVTCE